jgi:hypothetical protein
MNRQKLVLAVLLLLLVVAVISVFVRWPKQQSVQTLKNTGGATATAPRTPQTPVATPVDERRVHLELLTAERPRFSGFRRNIFRPIFQEEGKFTLPPKTFLKPPPPPSLPPVAVQPVPPPPVPTTSVVQRDMARFTFLGFLKKDGKKTIFLSKDNQIHLVKMGDRIEGKYEATGLSEEALTIRVLSDGNEIVIPLLENRPLISPR